MYSITDLPISMAPDVLGIGIDFGMTYSGAAIARFARGATLPDISLVKGRGDLGHHKIASKVYVDGYDRKAIAGNLALTRFLKDVADRGQLYELYKRELVLDEPGAGARTPDRTARALTAETIAEVLRDVEALIVKSGWANARRRYAFSFPASWMLGQQFRLRQAAESAGVANTNIHLIDESLATALAAAHLLAEHRRALQLAQTYVFVCDIGGGTLDLAVVAVNPTGLVQVVGPTFGAEKLGMSNVDKLLGLLLFESYEPSAHDFRQADNVLSNRIVEGAELASAWRSLGLSKRDQSRLLDLAEVFKIHVCNNWERHSEYPARGLNGTNMVISKAVLEPLFISMREEIQANIRLYFKQLADERFGISTEQIGFVIISGGGSALPGIHAALRELFPRAIVPVIPSTEATTMVQRGTAWFALQPSIVEQRRHGASIGFAALIPLQPDTLADRKVVAVVEGSQYEVAYCRFFRRGDLLSSESTELEFRVSRDNQDAVRICVYEGEHEILAENTLVQDVKVPLPRGARRDDLYLIVIQLEEDGMLHLRVKEEKNGNWLPAEMVLQWT